MIRPFVIVVADDWDFRNRCRGALVAAGYRVATPTTTDAAEYFLASVYPPHVVVLSARERWQEVLRDTIRRTVRPVVTAVVDRYSDEQLGGTGSVEEAVRAALEQLVGEPVAGRDNLRLGAEIIDAPHRAQVALLAALESAIRSGRRQDAIDRFQELRTHTEGHFSGEESLPQFRDCRSCEEHAREHVRLLEEIGELQARWGGADLPAIAPIILSLRDSFEGHIRTLDRTLARHLARNFAFESDR